MPADTPPSRPEIRYGGRQAGKTAQADLDRVIATRRGRIPNEQKWLEFREEEVPVSHVTRRVSIWTADFQHCLGIVQWNTAWRRYSFEPCFPTVFEHECLRHIAQLLEEMTIQHKARAGTATARLEASSDLASERLANVGAIQHEAKARTRDRGTPRNAPMILKEDDFFPAPSPVRHDDEAAR